MTEIAKKFNVPFEPDPEIMKPEEACPEEASEVIQGVPLIDFGGAVGGTCPIGFNVFHPPSLPTLIPAQPPPIPAQPPVTEKSNDSATAPSKNSVDYFPPPPNYDSIVKPSAKKETPFMPELPEVPDDSPDQIAAGPSDKKDEEDIDFDDLAKRFEALKKRK